MRGIELNDEQLLRYSRHILLEGFGIEGQHKLSASQVSIVGCGGLGHPLSFYLASSGVGRLNLFDHDKIEISNLQRQTGFKTEDIGQSKAQILKQALMALNPGIIIEAHTRQLAEKSDDIPEALTTSDLIIDCTDNFPSRFYLNSLSLQLKIPLLMGAAIEYRGLAGLFNTSEQAACYACLFDENDTAEQRDTCSTAGVFAPVPGLVGAKLAELALLYLMGQPHQQKLYRWDLKLDTYAHSFLERNQGCGACARNEYS